MSSEKDQEYLCEGMAEEIMNALVRIDGIRVASRTSAFRARRDGGDLTEIARALSVSHVLEGSVRTAGTRLRVTAQLTEVASGYALWSERFDREAADIFAVQDEIAAGVVDAVKARLAPGRQAVQPRQQVKDLEAYRHYLRGRHLRYTKNDHGGALRSYEQAVRLDPSHAPSWVGVAEVRVLMAFYGLAPARASYAAAKDALATAAGLQGESAAALYVDGMIAFGERRWRDAERLLRRAVELEPDHVPALCWLGVLMSVLARPDEAASVLLHATDVDPLAPYPHAMTAMCLLAVGRAAEAARHLERALIFDDENNLALWASGVALTALGDTTTAIASLERALTPAHRGDVVHAVLGWALAVAGMDDEAGAILDELRARPATAPALVSEAWLRAALGDMDGAWEVLGRSGDECQFFVSLAGMPGFDPLRTDPRFGALLQRLGLPSSFAAGDASGRSGS
jgi:serine/threonine-protein kinase